MAKTVTSAEAILDRALVLAAISSWEKMRLQDVAQDLNIDLQEIYRHYRQKDDLAEELFNRADRAVLATAGDLGFKALSGQERIREAILIWLDVLAPHRAAVIQMFGYKLEPGHIHLQVLGVLRVSRTVQWFLEAAGSRTTGLARILEEIGTTGVFLSTLVCWLRDTTAESVATRDFSARLLQRSEALAKRVNPDSIITKPPGWD
jgi:AcrR family transcriptional regulator